MDFQIGDTASGNAADERDMVKDFAAHYKLTHELLMLDKQEYGKASKAYAVSGIPTAVLIDPGVSSTFGPIVFTGKGPLCSSTSSTRKSESPSPLSRRFGAA